MIYKNIVNFSLMTLSVINKGKNKKFFLSLLSLQLCVRKNLNFNLHGQKTTHYLDRKYNKV
ncbi:MAG: hypothetical protein A2161_07525 [Candidatus Schekmanbacteria bacterium RBG_13_48_7]|uniref:Uncharacterized protein n=1 Tax=Candidatus Schekmanbacteria bacterium RBG_13_48_7 TaxID=1817878 RepID=A0A1F7RI01_9BACT|nr:MAG: hypothetical protein A2161_07525 [Candidatus Schekmanbacteria bacterium RBG_13_48_7]